VPHLAALARFGLAVEVRVSPLAASVPRATTTLISIAKSTNLSRMLLVPQFQGIGSAIPA